MGKFQTFFTRAHQDLRVSIQIDRCSCFQANSIMLGGQDLDTEVQALESITNLATVNTEEKKIILTLTATNTSLVDELIQLRNEFAAFRKTSRNLLKHYHWTCGTHCDHGSKICKVKNPGHKGETT